MISLSLAQDLALAGLRWEPEPGDRFALALEGFDDDVFTVSDITVEVHEYASGKLLGFNGTTEWPLDSVSLDQALWLPREDQLRGLLGGTFRSLSRNVDGEAEAFTVTTFTEGRERAFTSTNPAEAYALALDALISASADLGT